MNLSAATEFKNLFEKRYANVNFREGDVIVGTVMTILRDYVIVNIGFKSEGYISIEEFRNLDGEITVAPGDTVKVVLEEIEDDNGALILSKERADAVEAWQRVEALFDSGGKVDGLVTNKVKGGLSVNLGGIKAFLPGSQIDLKPVKSLDKLIGNKYTFKILKLNKQKGNIVLSRRTILEEERETMRRDILEHIKEGQIVRGTVKNLTDYGAFVDLGGIDGLLHITDVTWGRVNHPSDVLKVNEEIDVVVLKYEPTSQKISLGLKQLSEDPWVKVKGNYIPGERVKGKIVSIADYGVFVEVESGIEGLVHISELSWNKKIKHPSKIVKVGDEVEAVILDFDPANKKMALGLKQLEANPWDVLHQKFPIGSKIKGTIRNITDFGIFVGIDDEPIDGLVHVSDISWNQDFKWPSDDFKKGQALEVVVLNIDRDNQKFSLGLKQISDDPFAVLMRSYPLGSEVKATVDSVTDKGVTLNVAEGVVAFMPANETGISKTDLKTQFKPGDVIEAQVKKFDDRDRRMVVSAKMLAKRQEKESMRDFLKQQGDASVTLGDMLGKAKSE